MSDRDELRDKVAIAIDTAICTGDQSSVAMELTSGEIKTLADVAIAIVLEEAAKVVGAMPRTYDKVKEGCSIAGVRGKWTFTLNNGPAECAAVIRALKGNA